jgi:hypothetical protein
MPRLLAAGIGIFKVLLLYYVHFTGADTAVEPKSIGQRYLIIIHLNCIIRAQIFFT